MLNFNTRTGTPVCLFDEKEPTFYFDGTDINLFNTMQNVAEMMQEFSTEKSNELTLEILNEKIDKAAIMIDSALGKGVTSKALRGTKSFDQLLAFIEFLTEAIKNERKTLKDKYKKQIKKGVI